MSERDDRLARAGEYVLGLMDEAERVRIENDMLTDSALRVAVDAFAAHMHRLDLVQDDPVPDELWSRIAARIGDLPRQPAAAPAALSRTSRPAGPTWSRSTWSRLAFAASLLAGLGIGYIAGLMSAGTAQPVVLVVLDTAENVPGAIFEAYADNSVRVVPLEDFVVPDGQIMQVWTLYDSAVGPVSLGTMPRAEVTRLGGHSFPLPQSEQLYEITLEPAPGSPTGKPTGPILVKGFAKRPPA